VTGEDGKATFKLKGLKEGKPATWKVTSSPVLFSGPNGSVTYESASATVKKIEKEE
jgi:hypothetical protein